MKKQISLDDLEKELELTEDTSEIEDKLAMLIEKARAVKKRSDEASSELRILKEEIREFMIDSGIQEYAGIEIRRGFSWDIGMLKMEYPKIAEIYVKTETITTIKDSLSKRAKDEIMAKYPDVYRNVIVENTPQVRGL